MRDVLKLDNPVWHSLSETHQQLSINYNTIKFYHPDYCPFGAFNQFEKISEGIDSYSELCDNFFIVGEQPKFSKRISLKNELVCNQMVIDNKIGLAIEEKIEILSQEQGKELFDLVNLVQPGYFRRNTNLLGDYFGIFKEHKLIAVTGERMKMDGYTEVSAVVTHPDHTGKGYAKQLVTHTVNKIFDEGNVPFLHVAETNIPAITLYEKLGFSTRRKISF